MKRPTIASKTASKPAFERPRLSEMGKVKPNFDSLFNPAISNPLDSRNTEGKALEEVATEEVSVVLQTILDERKQRRDQYRIAADSEYWICLCFQSRAQKEQFLEQLGWVEHGDKYLDGLFCAQSLGINVEPIDLPMKRGTSRTPKSLRNTEVLK